MARKELLPSEAAEVCISSDKDGSGGNHFEDGADSPEDEAVSDQVPTLAIHEKKPIGSHSSRHAAGDETAANLSEHLPSYLDVQDKVLMNGERESSELKTKGVVSDKLEEIESSVNGRHDSFAFGVKSQDSNSRKVKLNQFLFVSPYL